MNHKLKQVVVRASRASKLLFQESSSSNNRRDALLRCVHPELDDHAITFQRFDDEEEEQRGEEERHGEEVKNVGEGLNEEEVESEEEAEVEVEHVTGQTQRSHMVTPPIEPAREEDMVLLKP
jgi:hypothetical protein